MSYEKGISELTRLCSLADAYQVRGLANEILQDPRFVIWSGSSKPNQHHYGKHGLIIHTLEVVELCLLNNRFFSQGDKSVIETKLFLAALFHDVGKMWDYEPLDSEMTEWQGSRHKRHIHHISRSALVWEQLKSKWPTIGFSDPEDEVLHAILAHHGQREYGSPVAPATRIAWLLHLCDSLSARMDDCYKFDRLTPHPV